MDQPEVKTLKKFANDYVSANKTVKIDYIVGKKKLTVYGKTNVDFETLVDSAKKFAGIMFNDNAGYIGEWYDFAVALISLKCVFDIDPIKKDDGEDIDIDATCNLYSLLCYGNPTEETLPNYKRVKAALNDVDVFLSDTATHMRGRIDHNINVSIEESLKSIADSLSVLSKVETLAQNANGLVGVILKKINEIDNGALMNYAGQIAKATSELDPDSILGAIVKAQLEDKNKENS